MKARPDARALVQELRRQGLSHREILQQVSVSKSSISLWCRTIELDGAKQQTLRQRKLDAGRNGLATIVRLRQSGQLTRITRKRKPPSLPIVDSRQLEEVKRLYWEERLSVREVATRMNMSFWRIYQLMRQHGISRRRGSEQNYATSDRKKPQFTVRKPLTPEDERLRAVGSVLYRAEGGENWTRH